MNKITIAIVIIILLIGGYYLLNQKEAPIADVSAETATSSATSSVATTTSVATSTVAATSTVDTKPEPVTFNMDSGAFYFKPNILKVKLGQTVTVNVNTVGGMHTFSIDEFSLDVKTPGGKITAVTFTPDKKGSFEFYCSMAGHRQNGQFGTLIVE